MRSMMAKATRVRRKFVRAMDSEVVIGEVKPTREKIVAEKYMSWVLGVSEGKEEGVYHGSLEKHRGWYEQAIEEGLRTTAFIERHVFRFEQWGSKGRTEFYRLLDVEKESHKGQHSQNHIVAAALEAYKQSSTPSYFPVP